MRNRQFASLILLAALSLRIDAAVLPPEKLAPKDTLVLLTIPDFSRLELASRQSPARLLWKDPVLQAFKEKFINKFKEAVLTPLEQQLGVKFADYAELAQGQVTIAVVQNGWDGKSGKLPGWVLLVDSKDKRDDLKKRLAELKQKWTDAGKSIKVDKIRDVEFTTLIVSKADMAKTLEKSMPGAKPAKEPAETTKEKADDPKYEISVGQSDSVLVVGNAPKVIENILIRQSGGMAPSLDEQAGYEATHQAVFRDSLVYGWANLAPIVETLTRQATDSAGKTRQPNPMVPQTDKIMAAVGLNGLKTVAMSMSETSEGTSMQLFLNAPEGQRQGLFKLLAVEPKEATPPPFVPGDAVKFYRWRLDGQKAWTTLEAMINEISPQMGGILQMSLAAVGKDKDPNFDFKKSLIGNLGNDMISFQKAPRGVKLADLASAPSLFLLGSANPDQLALALKAGAALMPAGPGGAAVKDRDFLGHKIYSVSLPATPDPTTGRLTERAFSFGAGGGYVAMGSDPSMIEEYLRNSEASGKTLRETPGLNEAAQKVGGMNTGMFGYENYTETVRLTLEAVKADPEMINKLFAMAPKPAGANASSQFKDAKDWLDFSMLPAFDRISKYFHFTVYTANATPEGLSIKVFSPTPPQLTN